MKKSKSVLKSYFETGDKPTESQFSDLIDSLVHQDEENRIYITGTNTNDKGDTIVKLSNGKSITIQKPHEVKTVNQDNKIRVIDLGGVYYHGGGPIGVELRSEENVAKLPSPVNNFSIEDVLVDVLNKLDPPITIAEDEIVIFEYTLREPQEH